MEEQLILLHEIKDFLHDVQTRLSLESFTIINAKIDQAINLNVKNTK